MRSQWISSLTQHEVVAAAEVQHRLDLVPPPHAAERVVRVAEEQHARVRRDRRFHGVERQLPAAVAQLGRHRDEPPVPVAGGASRKGG